MDYIEKLINDDNEGFRGEIHSALYNKIKEKLQDKKIELAATLYDEIPDQPEESSE